MLKIILSIVFGVALFAAGFGSGMVVKHHHKKVVHHQKRALVHRHRHFVGQRHFGQRFGQLRGPSFVPPDFVSPQRPQLRLQVREQPQIGRFAQEGRPGFVPVQPQVGERRLPRLNSATRPATQPVRFLPRR